ncbi:MAG: hypothetical protein ABGZ49_14530 [Akkermansiaceae bacterium]
MGETTQTGKKGLPSGQGLACKYAGDTGIAQHPAVIFADNFESGALSGPWDEARNQKTVLNLARVPGGPVGKRSLRVEAPLGKDTGGGVTKWFQPTATLFVRFYTRFDEKCDSLHHFVTLRANKSLQGGDHWSGFGGAGNKPRGDDRFSTALEPWGDWGRNPPPGK